MSQEAEEDFHLDKEFIDFSVKCLVSNPDAVKVERTTDEMGVLLTVDVAPQDMGSVIGKLGCNAKALRTLLRSIGSRQNARVNMKINDPQREDQGYFRTPSREMEQIECSTGPDAPIFLPKEPATIEDLRKENGV